MKRKRVGRWVKWIILLMVVNMVTIGVLGYTGSQKDIQNSPVMFTTKKLDKKVTSIEDKKLWDYLLKETPKFDFDTLDKQYFLFDNKTKQFFKSIDKLKGSYVHFPPVNEKILPYGITLMYEGAEYKKDYVKVWVRTTEEVKFLTEKDLKELKEQLEKQEKKTK